MVDVFAMAVLWIYCILLNHHQRLIYDICKLIYITFDVDGVAASCCDSIWYWKTFKDFEKIY
ncbi:hypothetical protein MTBBW1_2300008 [Desulfamplus magnetovallimortis]|uniref:Uncharacterized protein n=1 Tax=Desulfamplus magnetovallimortis TaxID=1246637 RepID=A0A1W1HDM2_9BACT|nr:hypothetical protein MTBBW1_2300008 [Desulfamplus magnetovallimortis]